MFLAEKFCALEGKICCKNAIILESYVESIVDCGMWNVDGGIEIENL